MDTTFNFLAPGLGRLLKNSDARISGLQSGRAHAVDARGGTVELRGLREGDQDAPLAGWRYTVSGHGWAYSGDLDKDGRAIVHVGRGAKAPYQVKLSPPTPPAAPTTVDLTEPGSGISSERRSRSAKDALARLKALFK